MGYTTKFTGSFKLNTQMNNFGFFDILTTWQDRHKISTPNNIKIPDGYCQWVLNKDRTAIEWDGNEKFYEYSEWLQCVIDLLKPAGFILTGKVEYQGEDISDHGWIEVKENMIKMIKLEEKNVTCPHCGHQFHLTEGG